MSSETDTNLMHDRQMLSGQVGLKQTIFVQKEPRHAFVIRVVERDQVPMFKVVRSTHPRYPIGTAIPVKALYAPDGAFPTMNFGQFCLRGRLRRLFKRALGTCDVTLP